MVRSTVVAADMVVAVDRGPVVVVGGFVVVVDGVEDFAIMLDGDVVTGGTDDEVDGADDVTGGVVVVKGAVVDRWTAVVVVSADVVLV